jgi:hypothetical protein
MGAVMEKQILLDLEQQTCDLIKAGETYSISSWDQAFEAAAIMLQALEKRKESIECQSQPDA